MPRGSAALRCPLRTPLQTRIDADAAGPESLRQRMGKAARAAAIQDDLWRRRGVRSHALEPQPQHIWRIAASSTKGGSNRGLVIVHKARSLPLLSLCRERRDRRQSQGLGLASPDPYPSHSARGHTSEDDYAARDGTGGQQPEAFIDLVELVGAANQAVEVDALVHGKIGEHAKVDRGPDRTVIGA